MVKTLIVLLIAGLAALGIAYAIERGTTKLTRDLPDREDMRRSRAIRLVVSTFLPIGAMVLYIWSLYASRLVRTVPEWIDLLIFFCSLLGGTLVLSFGPWRRRTKMLLVGAYVPVMVLALGYAWLSAGCAMGDCL